MKKQDTSYFPALQGEAENKAKSQAITNALNSLPPFLPPFLVSNLLWGQRDKTADPPAFIRAVMHAYNPGTWNIRTRPA